jgi:hypothetical protein
MAGRHRVPTTGAVADLTTAALPPIRTVGIAFVFRTGIVGTRRGGAHDDTERQCQSDKTTLGTALISSDEVTGSLCAAVGTQNMSCFTGAYFIRPAARDAPTGEGRPARTARARGVPASVLRAGRRIGYPILGSQAGPKSCRTTSLRQLNMPAARSFERLRP